MPKFGAHILFAELAHAKSPALFPDVDENAVRLGAIGPDMTLFLLDPITNPIVRKGLDLALSVLTVLNDVKEELERITAIFDGPPADLSDWVTGGLSRDLKSLLSTSMDTLVATLKLGVAGGSSGLNLKNPLFGLIGSGGNPLDLSFLQDVAIRRPTIIVDSLDNFGFPFRYFGHPYTDDGAWKKPEAVGDYSNWWWMDMLHYRKTGTFAMELLNRASGPVQTGYARGYMSHVAGDICGHPYINSLVGGPFRNHAYRHIVLESLADTWLWRQQGRGDICDARLDKRIRLGWGQIHQVADLICDSMRAVYRQPELPNLLPNRYPEPSEIVGAYDKMSLYLRLSTSGSVKRPIPPPDSLNEIVEEMQELLSRNQPSSFPSGGGSAVDYIVAILSWLLKGIVLIAMILTLPAALLLRIIGVAPRWILYFIHLGVFMIHSGIRSLLAMMGWGYAGAEDFDNFGFLKDWIVSPGDCVEEGYPFSTLPNPKPPFYWLVQPRRMSKVEDPRTVAGPMKRGVTPFWLVDPANRMDPDPLILDAFAQSRTQADTIALERAVLARQSSGFGNAVDFTIGLLDGSLPVPDLDLDGDRGFGFRTWEGLPPSTARFV